MTTAIGPAAEMPQWWPHARVRQRKTALVTIPSNHPRMAEMMTNHTSDTVDEPTTQLNMLCSRPAHLHMAISGGLRPVQVGQVIHDD